MGIALIIYGFISVLVVAFIIFDIKYYEHKLPTETVDEINSKIKSYNDMIANETDYHKIGLFLDKKEYWEQQKQKLIKYGK